MILIDAGTSYAKILENGELRVLRTEAVPEGLRADRATGHNAARFSSVVVNELVALVRGGTALVPEEEFTLVDVGARDMKVVRVAGGALRSCDWNDSCGALCGFGLELLGRQYGLDWTRLPPAQESLRVACGIFAFAEMFDLIASGTPVDRAAARFVRGLAEHIHGFAGRPSRFYLSGGLVENPLFLVSFDADVRPLGRAVLLEGLKVAAHPA